MLKYLNKILLVVAILVASLTSVQADILRDGVNDKEEERFEAQRTSSGVFDNQKNTISNIEFFTSNWGLFGYDVKNRVGGGYWPRGSRNQYIFGGGCWFAAQKRRPNEPFVPDTIFETNGEIKEIRWVPNYKKYVLVTYNPSNARSWMVPGRFDDGLALEPSKSLKYRTYFSTDFSTTTGVPFNNSDGPNWPIWDVSTNPEDTLKIDRYFGFYVHDDSKRTVTEFPKGPAFISGEDIFATFKDTDLNYYDGGYAVRFAEGYPLYMQTELMMYSWGFGLYKDFVFVKYDFINKSHLAPGRDGKKESGDTLMNCWMAPIMDVDVARAPQTALGAQNDRVRFYDADTTLNMASQWSNPQNGEGGFGFGYLGFDFLESPSIIRHFDTVFTQNNDTILTERFEPDTRMVRKDRPWYPNAEQLGLVTFRNWSSQDDKRNDEDRYNFLSESIRDGDTGEGDKRYMMATGPFHMRPDDTVRVVVAIIIANTAKGGDADGTDEDMKNLVELDKFAQDVYDNSFRAPQPPDRTSMYDETGKPYITGLNNACKIKWDNTAEMSHDKLERGLDFMGYRIYRARRVDLDTFSLDEIAGGGRYSRGAGIFGWKQVAEYSIQTPFNKSNKISGENIYYPAIDEIQIVGPHFTDRALPYDIDSLDQMAIDVMRVGKGMIMAPYSARMFRFGDARPAIYGYDTIPIYDPWGKDFYRIGGNKYQLNDAPLRPTLNNYSQPIFKDVTLGHVAFNRSLVSFNPFWFRKTTDTISTDTYASLKSTGVVNRLNYVDTLVYDLKTNDTTGETYREYRFTPREIPCSEDRPGKYQIGDRCFWNDSLRSRATFETDTVDAVYVLDSYRRVNINGTNVGFIDVWKPRIDLELYKSSNNSLQLQRELMTDTTHLKEIVEFIYQSIQSGLARVEFPSYEDDINTRTNVISKYMERITNDRTFIDVGDDNGDNEIFYDQDPKKTEKLINNVDYYYKVEAYDEGDFNQPTPQKLNGGQFGSPNVVKVSPEAGRVGNLANVEIINQETDKLGGLHNFNFFGIDPDRLQQQFGGDTLELTFNPVWQLANLSYNRGNVITTKQFGYYRTSIILTNLTKNKVLYSDISYLEDTPCNLTNRSLLTEDGFSIVYSDTVVIDSSYQDPVTNEFRKITFGVRTSREVLNHSGIYTTGDFKQPNFCRSSNMFEEAYGILGFSFNFNMKKFGGLYRPDSTTSKAEGVNAKTYVTFMDVASGSLDNNPDIVMTTQRVGNYSDFNFLLDFGLPVAPGTPMLFFFPGNAQSNPPGGSAIKGTNFKFGSFNAGPGNYEVEFLPGGKEEVTLNYVTGGNPVEKKFTLDYLNMRVKNVMEMPADSNEENTFIIKYPGELPHMAIPPYPFPTDYRGSEQTEGVLIPDPRNIGKLGGNTNDFIGKYNIAAFGMVNHRGNRTPPPSQFGNIMAKGVNAPYKDGSFFKFTGLQGRYYMTGVSQDGQDSIDFAHIINIGGVQFVLDRTGKNRVFGLSALWQGNPEWTRDYYTQPDFVPGDKVYLKTIGGAFGLPLPGASVKAVVKSNSSDNYTEEQLEDVMVVPNPYYISHEAQRSPYDSKIYFTKLPKVCTIEIYTATGDLIKTIEHNEFRADDPSRSSIDVWDLLTDSYLRVQSQSLFAIVKTPNGEQAVRKFSVVVGKFRIVED